MMDCRGNQPEALRAGRLDPAQDDAKTRLTIDAINQLAKLNWLYK
jgi:hypothetical protein